MVKQRPISTLIVSLSIASAATLLLLYTWSIRDPQSEAQIAVPQHETVVVFGLAPGARYLSWSGYGRLSNNLAMLAHAVGLAARTGRRLLVFPPAAQLDGTNHDRRLSWLQLVDLDALNVQLHPDGRRCQVRGLNHGPPDADIQAYVRNGTSATATGCAVPGDAPPQLLDPNAWSADCYLLPWTSTAPVAASSVTASIPLVTTTAQRAEHRFPGPSGTCPRTSLDVPRHLVVAGWSPFETIISLPDPLILTTGDVMFRAKADGDDVVVLPPSAAIRHVSDQWLRWHSGPVLCVHARRDDLSLIPLERYIEAINAEVQSGAVMDVIVVSDANEAERQQLRDGIRGTLQIGCDRERFAPCANSADMRAAIEQQVCADADRFIGSPESTFTARIVQLRRYRGASMNSTRVLAP